MADADAGDLPLLLVDPARPGRPRSRRLARRPQRPPLGLRPRPHAVARARPPASDLLTSSLLQRKEHHRVPHHSDPRLPTRPCLRRPRRRLALPGVGGRRVPHARRR
ncbi:hypothetical protein PLANTIT3_50319 [Plantibacter sp. T3]|nr:hypothetical protein PLANTIT3_50319 [Plantibacter sp. T3]